MNQLVFETSSLPGSLAVLRGDSVLAEIELNSELRTAQSLAPAIVEQLRRLAMPIGDIRLISCTQGPGSFTGLRVGVTMAKTLAYALGAEVIGVNTLEVIAEQAPLEVHELSVVMDAQRQQLFELRLRRRQEHWTVVEPTRIVDNEEWIARLDPNLWVSGPGLRRLASLPQHVRVVDPTTWTPRAATAGRVALRAYSSGRRDDVWALVPHYVRRSAAEEKRDDQLTE